MKAIISNSKISGKIRAPRSKSHAIRLIFSSLLCNQRIIDIPNSKDVQIAIDVIKKLGVEIKGNEYFYKNDLKAKEASFYLGGSATSLRFLIPILSVIGGTYLLDGDEYLRNRPLRAIYESLNKVGIRISSDKLPLRLEGKLLKDEIEIRGDESSQYISGFMYAFSIKGNGKIKILGHLSSKSYVFLTKEVLEEIGVKVKISNQEIEVYREESNREISRKVQGDFLLSSFYTAASLITEGNIEIHDLPKPKSYFGDHSIHEIYKNMNANSEFINDSWICNYKKELNSIDIDIDDAPDLAPSIAAIASISNGITKLRNVSRLAFKESNRINSIKSILNQFGVHAYLEGNTLCIEGIESGKLRNTTIESFNDHRIVMLSAVLALRNGGKIIGAEAVNKSNPEFWNDLMKIGGRIKIEA